MQMISSIKMRKAQNTALSARPFARAIDSMVQSVSTGVEDGHPLLAREDIHSVLLLAIGSDQGLCGGFNAAINRSVLDFMDRNRDKFKKINVATIGRKVFRYLKLRDIPIQKNFTAVWDNLSYTTSLDIARYLADEFLSHEADAIFLIYNGFKSAVMQEVSVEQILPMVKDNSDETELTRSSQQAAKHGEGSGKNKGGTERAERAEGEEWEEAEMEPIYEPDPKTVFDQLIPRHLAVQVNQALLESAAAEQSARMMAMEGASRNAKEMIDSLSLSFHRARQGKVTQELTEIVSGAQSIGKR